jgi:hypothetical protein
MQQYSNKTFGLNPVNLKKDDRVFLFLLIIYS